METKKETNDMLSENSACQTAFSNLSCAINANDRLPKNIFIGGWSGFFFFDADWIFDAQFVEKAKALLKIDGGQCACMSDLDAALSAERLSFFIDKETSNSAYQSFLNGPSVGEGWLHGVGRIGCTSDAGQWCIYCEKGNEIAVIATREDRELEKYGSAIAQFKALPIDRAIGKPLSYGFSERALSAAWRSELLRQYAPSAE